MLFDPQSRANSEKKEGKKGPVSDGESDASLMKVSEQTDYHSLQAIHDRSVHRPSIFVPAFTEPLPSLLGKPLAPRLALRMQACHARGGLALGASQILLSYRHTRHSETVAAALTMAPVPSLTSSPSTRSAGYLFHQDTAYNAQGARSPSWCQG